MSDAFRFEYKGENYQRSGDGGCRLCAAKGEPCESLHTERQDHHPCLGATTMQEFGPNFVKVKLPEPPAPKSLSLDEILAEQEAKPSDDSADVMRYEASFRHGASEAQGWTARAEVSTEAKPSEDPAPTLREKLEAKAKEHGIPLEALLPKHDDLFAKHDGHYRTLEAKGAEPIERMEALVCRGIPEDLHRIAKRNLNMAMASKHQDRAGEKSGEAWEKELQKAENYLHRAWSGRWIG